MRKKTELPSCLAEASNAPSPLITLTNVMPKPDFIQLFTSPSTIQWYYLLQSIGLSTSIPQYPFLHLKIMQSFWGFQGFNTTDDLLSLEVAIRYALFFQRHQNLILTLKISDQPIFTNQELRVLVDQLINQRIVRGIHRAKSEATFKLIKGKHEKLDKKTEETRIYFQHLLKEAQKDDSECLQHKIMLKENSFPTRNPSEKNYLKKYETQWVSSAQKNSKKEKKIKIDTILEEDEDKQEKKICRNEERNRVKVDEKQRMGSNADLNSVNQAQRNGISSTDTKKDPFLKIFENAAAKVTNGVNRNRHLNMSKMKRSIQDTKKPNVRVFDFSNITFQDWIESELKSIEKSLELSPTFSSSSKSLSEKELLDSKSFDCKDEEMRSHFALEMEVTSVNHPDDHPRAALNENQKNEIKKLSFDQTSKSSVSTIVLGTNPQGKMSFKHESETLQKTKINVKKYDDKMVSQLSLKQGKKEIPKFESIIEEEEEEEQETHQKLNSAQKTTMHVNSNSLGFRKDDVHGEKNDPTGLCIPVDLKIVRNRTSETEVSTPATKKENVCRLNNEIFYNKDNVTLNHESRISKRAQKFNLKKYEEKMIVSQIYPQRKKVTCFETIVEEDPVGVSIQVSDGGSMKLSVKEMINAFDSGLLPEALVREKLTPMETQEVKANKDKDEFKKTNVIQPLTSVSMDAVKEIGTKLTKDINETVLKAQNTASVMKTSCCTGEAQSNNAVDVVKGSINRRSSINPSEKTLATSEVKSVPSRVLINVKENEEQTIESSKFSSAQKDDASTFYTSQDSKDLISSNDLASILPKSISEERSLKCETTSHTPNAHQTTAGAPRTKKPWIKRITQKIKNYVSSRFRRQERQKN